MLSASDFEIKTLHGNFEREPTLNGIENEELIIE